MSARSSSSRDGFSLVEMLVALVVASFVLAALSGLHRGFSSVDERVARVAALQDEILTASRFLRATLERSLPGGPPEIGGGTGVLRIRTLGMPLDEADGPLVLSLSTRRFDGGTALVARWPDRSPPFEETLLSGPTHLRLRYLISGPSGLSWNEGWTDPKHLPLAVALEVEHPDLGPALTMVFRTGMRDLATCRNESALANCGWRE